MTAPPVTKQANTGLPDWRTLILAAIIVATGIYIISESSSQAGWLLAFTILIGVAFANQNFGPELVSLLQGK